MPAQKISISLSDRLAAQIDTRGSVRSQALAQSLERYFFILDSARRRLAEMLSDQETALILDALNGTGFFEPFSIHLVDAEIADALADNLASKWQVDADALTEKLRQLSYTEKVALVDAAERWWNRAASGEQPEYAEALRK